MKVKEIIKLVKDAIEYTKMTNAGFSKTPNDMPDKDYTKEIIEATRIYRNTWIIGTLELALEELKK